MRNVIFLALLFSAAFSYSGEFEEIRNSAADFGRVNLDLPNPVRNANSQNSLDLIPDEVINKLRGMGIDLEDADIWRIAEISNFWQQQGHDVWPGRT